MAGELLTTDYEIEYDGLVFGQSNIEVTGISGVLSSPDIRSNDNNRPLQDGTFPGNDYYGERVVVVDLEVWGYTPEEMASNLQAVMAATTIRNREQPMVIRMAGWTDDITINARPRDRSGFDVTRDMVLGYVATGSVMFVASNPAILLGTEDRITQIPLSGETPEGLQFDLTFDITFGAATLDGSATIRNSGSAPADVVFTIDGEVTNPTITAIFPDGTTKTLDMDIAMTASDSLELSSLGRNVLLNTNLNYYNALQDSSQWFRLPVGDTLIQFGGTVVGGTPPVLTVAWRNTYM